ncbi:hypothetical protein F2Q68_00042391 [Brassica cretica]|uniref:Purple acid phosphatase Fn3-like domain-containing protein n=1 Tax=Brassica cretica TaxID=69181 RepID=A0A8S9MB14_BRACR|nr:hypothetical protein F2Q68_00042391 [Brassica cretica]
MKKVFLNLMLLSFLLDVAFHLANGAEVNHQGQCDSDLECYTMRSCQRGQCDTDLECYTMHCDRGDGYCDHSNVDGVCKCPKTCTSNPECSGMGCDTGRGYCNNGACKCPKLQAVETKKHTNGVDLNHLGQCDTDLECYTMPSCNRGQGYCDNNGVCKCPILQCHANPDCLGMRCFPRAPPYCNNGVCRCPKLQAVETKKRTNGVDLNHLGQCDTDLECYTMPSCNRGNGYCDQKDGKWSFPLVDMRNHQRSVAVLVTLVVALALGVGVESHKDQPLSGIAIHETTFHLNDKAHVKASPTLLGSNGQHSEIVLVEFSSPHPSDDDWIGVFSPANFNASTCPGDNKMVSPPRLCSAPIKFQYANFSNPRYNTTGTGSLKLQIINQRSDFSFALFSGGLLNPKLVAVSNKVAFENPNAPVYPRLALGKEWDEVRSSKTLFDCSMFT